MFNTLTVRTWDLMIPRPSWVLVTNPDRQLPCHFSKTVLRIPSKAGIPIFAMTANAFEEDRQNALKAGMDGHIAKPLDIPHLLQILTDVLK